ncbi:zinc finger protein 41-like [Aricia agestis]|uniref:zinc finger protein 41-like n=1 Tax=Aricia agestis TaxID=91739 RepID=UPI001C20B688|nr:zinc finger protein 41-like [Aricia agestis]
MVGHWLLMHVLRARMHNRKRLQIKQDPQNYENTKPSVFVSNFPVKVEIFESENVQTCRVCLQSGEIPIYSGKNEELSGALATFGGIVVESDDKYPKFLCTSCHELLQGAILLRKTAQQSDKLLRQSETENLSESAEAEQSDNNSVPDEKDVDDTWPYYCKTCDIGFNTFDEYNEHSISDEHENKECPYCKKMYSTRYLKTHLAEHRMEYNFICDVCGKEFVRRANFAQHRAIHFHDLPFQCSHCPYKGRFKEALKMHMRSHTGEKPYPCPQCPARFVSKSNLNRHMHTHQTEPEHKCETCGRGFHTKREVEVHFKVEHNGIKDHVCNMCGKAFGYRSQMMKHQRKVHKRQKMKSGRTPVYLQVQSKEQEYA